MKKLKIDGNGRYAQTMRELEDVMQELQLDLTYVLREKVVAELSEREIVKYILVSLSFSYNTISEKEFLINISLNVEVIAKARVPTIIKFVEKKKRSDKLHIQSQ